MKASILLLIGALGLLPGVASAKIVRQVDQAFAVAPGGTLRVQTFGGDVRVATADVAEVRVSARQTFRTNSEVEADEILAGMTFRLVQDGGDVVAEARMDRKGGWSGQSRVAVDFTVTVPLRFNVDLATSGGDIQVGDLIGSVKARTSGGDLDFARIAGDVEGRTSGGDIVLFEGTARAVLETSGGNVTVTRAGGPTKVSTSGGDIFARLAEAPKHDLDLSTSGVHVRLAVLELSTSGGDIRLTVPPSAAFALDARTSGGGVDATGLTLTLDSGGVGKSRLAGTVNGGGPGVRLRTSGGDIRVRAE